MSDAFSAATDTLFNNADLSTSGVYTPAGGAPQTVRVLKRIPPTNDISLGASRVSTSGITALLARVRSAARAFPRRCSGRRRQSPMSSKAPRSTARNLQWALDATPQ
jgi:hypothetical protein